MELRRRWLLAIVLMLAICPLLAATNITYTITGTLGPKLAGSDPLGANGETGTLTATASTTLTPTSKTKTSATYTLPAGAITVVIGGTTYTTTGTSTLKYTFPASGADTMTFTTTVTVDGIDATIVGTASLANASFPKAILKHPAKFVPTPQSLTPATSASGAGSKVSYSAALIGKTVLGITGTASSTASK